MSSAGGNSSAEGGGGGSAATSAIPQMYFCHQCNCTVSITPSSTSSDLTCPNCDGGFIEEVENPGPTANPYADSNPFVSFSTELGGPGMGHPPFVFSTSSTAGSGGHGGFDDLAALFSGIGSNRPSQFQDPEVFNPFLFLQNYLQTLRAGGGNVQFVIENSGDPTGTHRLPANLSLGDYFIGPGLEQLIQQLAENDPNRYGTPPASKSALEGLPNIKISKEMMASDSSQCAVCKDSFELEEEAKQLPCKHIYHSECILPWLQQHNSCPVCRFELPTDDPDYEQRRGNPVDTNRYPSAGVSEGGNGAGSGDNPLTPRTVERRFRVQLPWPFRAFGSPAETSNSGTGNNNGNDGSGEQNTENRGNQNLQSEPRQEDLD